LIFMFGQLSMTESAVLPPNPGSCTMTLYSAFICWLIFNELFVLAVLRPSQI
jgi:hypothetical protein